MTCKVRTEYVTVSTTCIAESNHVVQIFTKRFYVEKEFPRILEIKD